MAIDIRAMIDKKSKDRINSKKLIMKDVNHDLIVALLAIPIYGKEARDEEILSVIINSGKVECKSTLSKIKEEFDKDLKDKKLKKSKDGVVDKDGFFVLVPR